MGTQKEIAEYLGLTQATVSYALRNHPSISDTTKKKVREAAERLGYTPNPLVSALMEHIREGRPLKEQGNIAVVVDQPNREHWLDHLARIQQYEGIKNLAARRGYRVEEFYLKAPGMSARRLDEILFSRGIVGIIFASHRGERAAPLEIRWEHYSMVKSGYMWPSVPCDMVAPNYRMSVELAFRELRKRGRKRIGLILYKNAMHRVGDDWIAALGSAQYGLPRNERLPILPMPVQAGQGEVLRAYCKRWTPDALISLDYCALPWMAGLGMQIPSECAYVSLNHDPEKEPAAVDMRDDLVGESLCSHLLDLIIHNQRGLPEYEKRLLVNPRWVDGWSAG